MKKYLLITITVLSLSGCRRNLQDFGILPADKEPTYDTRPYSQYIVLYFPNSHGQMFEDVTVAFPPKTITVRDEPGSGTGATLALLSGLTYRVTALNAGRAVVYSTPN